MKVFKWLFIVAIVFVAKNQYAQCVNCNLTVVSNSVSNYNVASNYTLCINAGLTYTGTINLNGGTLCNNGVVSKVNFNSGTFNNYGGYNNTGNLSIQNTALLTINNYSGSYFRVGGNIDIQSSLVTTETYINLQKGKTSFDVTGNFSCTKGVLGINPKTDAKQFTEGVYFNIGKDFYVGGNASLIMNIGRGTYFNVNKIASFDGKYNKIINNYGGAMNFNNSFNIGGNGQNTGVFKVLNTNNGSITIKKAFNAAYNNGTVDITNYSTIDVGTTWTQSKDITTVTNNGSLSITQDLNIERGSLINNGKLYARDGDIKFGTLTNNYYINFSRDLITSNNAATINNSGYILINREFNNTATVNLLEKSTLETAKYYNTNNGIINGPASPPDTISYARIIVSDYSENKGYINNKIIFYDQTLQYTNNNKGYGFDVVANTNRIAGTIIFALKIPIIIGPPIFNCAIFNFLYGLDIGSTPAPLCLNPGGVLNLTSQFYKKIYTPGGINKLSVTLPPNSYVWTPTASFPGTMQFQQNPIINSPNVTTTYTVKVIYGGCQFIRTITVYDCNMYAVMNKEISSQFYKVVANKVYFKYDGEYNSHSIKYNVYNKQHQSIASNSTNNVLNSLSVVSGDNRYFLDVSGSLFTSGYYLLEVIDEKNDKLYLKFKK